MTDNKLPHVSTEFDTAHEVTKGDPRIDGPYLDDIRAKEADDRRAARMQPPAKKAEVKAEKKAEPKAKKSPAVKSSTTKKAAAKKAPAPHVKAEDKKD